MPKKLTEAYFASLAQLIGTFPQGACIHELRTALDDPLPQRTLQDHLARLVKQNRVTITGKGVARCYHLPEPSNSHYGHAPAKMPAKAGTTSTVLPDKAAFLVPPSGGGAHNENCWPEPQTTWILRESPAELQIDTIPLSAEAESIRTSVSRPLSLRRPVGYNRAFLDEYSPNETHYLPAELRLQLAGMGRIYQDNQPAGTYAREIHNRLLIDLSWNSSRLEGNTYSLLETEQLLEAGYLAKGKDTREAQMILNHKAAIELLLDDSVDIGFNRYTICNLHALLSDHLLSDQGACGRLRTKPVGVTGTLFHPLGVPQMIEECFDTLLDKAASILDPFEQAFFVMVQLPYLQPFVDVNKRVSRLAANIPLIRMNLCPLSFVHVPDRHYTGGVLGVYELNAIAYLRDVFIWAYQQSSDRYSAVRQTLGDPDPFVLRHRTQIKELVGSVVRSRMSKTEAIAWIRAQTDGRTPRPEQQRLVEIVETELMSLHSGSIARYALRPSEFDRWKEGWQ